MTALRSSRLHALALALGACLVVAGCTPTAAPPARRHTGPLGAIKASFVGPQGVPDVTAQQFLGAKNGWFGVIETGASNGSPVGDGTLMRTTDGGKSWTPASKVPGEILAIDFLTQEQGYVVVQESGGAVLLKTADGGATLIPVSTAPGSGGTAQLHFTSAAQGFLVNGQTLDVTADGGVTWRSSPVTLPGPPPAPGTLPPQAFFLTATEGFVVNGEGLYRTTNGGGAWQEVYALPAQMLGYDGGGQALGPISFASPTLGYVALNVLSCWAGGCPDVILRTEDGGATWSAVSAEMQGPLPGITSPMTGPPGGINALLGFGSQDVIAATMQGLYMSRDGGVTWKPATSPPASSPTQFANLSYDPQAGVFAGGLGNLIEMTPSGLWRPLWPDRAPTAAIDFTSPTTGYGIQMQPEMALLKSLDGGRTWRPLYVPQKGWLPLQVSFSGKGGWLLLASNAQVQTQSSEVLATADGGTNWRVLQTPDAHAGQLLPGGWGVLLAYGNSASPSLYTTRDGGLSFAKRALPNGSLLGFAFSSAHVGYAVAEPKYSNELLYQTTDGGRTWHKLALPRFPQNSLVTYQDFAADNEGDLWVLLSQHVYGEPLSMDIYIRYRDGQWRQIKIPESVGFTYAPQQALTAVSARTAWLLLAGGLFETTDGGRVWRNLTSPLPN